MPRRHLTHRAIHDRSRALQLRQGFVGFGGAIDNDEQWCSAEANKQTRRHRSLAEVKDFRVPKRVLTTIWTAVRPFRYTWAARSRFIPAYQFVSR